MQSASSLGDFAAMNLGAADDTRREIESLRTQVSVLKESLRKATEECTVMATRVEKEHDKHKTLVAGEGRTEETSERPTIQSRDFETFEIRYKIIFAGSCFSE